MLQNETKAYDVAIIGAGASGSALLYLLTHYTDIGRIALIEKNSRVGMVNSNARNNSQTLHVGDIETNYSAEKVRQVYPAAMMVKKYVDSLPATDRTRIMRQVQKMVLGVGAAEVAELEQRAEMLKDIFPALQKLDAPGIAAVEPEVMRGRATDEPVLALFTEEGYAVDYGALAESLVRDSESYASRADILLATEVERIVSLKEGYELETASETIRARVVICDADAYSLGFAKQLGYGHEFSLIPIAGSFFFTPERLRGKVYRVQDPRMPFAAVHGDPDLTAEHNTRWGPTARFYPALEARDMSTALPFFRAAGFERPATWLSFASILLDPLRFWYLFRNLLFDLPYVGRYFLLPQLHRIVPTLRASDLSRARGYGGMRLQRVDTRSRELLLGEGKIVGKDIVFNMTPSPGASVCLYNAMRDVEQIVTFLPQISFDRERLKRDLCITLPLPQADVSLTDTYAS